jgi:hypothetical protein
LTEAEAKSPPSPRPPLPWHPTQIASMGRVERVWTEPWCRSTESSRPARGFTVATGNDRDCAPQPRPDPGITSKIQRTRQHPAPRKRTRRSPSSDTKCNTPLAGMIASVRSNTRILTWRRSKRETRERERDSDSVLDCSDLTYNTRWSHAYSLPLTYPMPPRPHTHTHAAVIRLSYSSGAFLPQGVTSVVTISR